MINKISFDAIIKHWLSIKGAYISKELLKKYFNKNMRKELVDENIK